MKLYRYHQNNSGGSFDETEDLTRYVYIEAPTEEKADAIGQELGMYFNGVESGIDCPCCGSRWYGAYEDTDYSSKEEATEELQQEADNDSFRFTKIYAIIHWADGKKTKIRHKEG